MTLKQYEIGCKLLLITDRKSHMGFRLVQKSVTLNDLEQRNLLILRYFTEFNRLGEIGGLLCHSG